MSESNISRRRMFPVVALVAVGLSAAVIAPYFFSRSIAIDGHNQYTLISTHDISNHYHLAENFDKSLREGNLYPRWFGEPNDGYGIAVMNYYPPGLFYLTSAVNLIFANWHSTLFVLMALALGGSAISMYILARTFLGTTAAGIAAGLYALLPYHLLDLYWRGALPEFVGFAFIPLIFYFAYRVGRNDGKAHYAGLGLSFGLHLLIQLPVSVLLVYTLAFYAVCWAIKRHDARIVLRIAAGLGLGLAIAAVYWLPAALEMGLVYQNALEIYPYHTSYVSPAITTEPFLLELQYCFKTTAAILIAAVVVLQVRRRTGAGSASEDREASAQRFLWLLCCGAALFMATAFSYDVSRLLPKLELALPAFRWLAIAAFFGALTAGGTVQQMMRTTGAPARTALVSWGILGAAIALNLWTSASAVVGGALENNDFTPPVGWVEPTMTPASATRPAQLPDTPNVVIDPPGGTGDIVRWESERREIRVIVDQPSRIRLKTYNFPGWTAWVDGQKTQVESDSDGIQVVSVPAGQHKLDVRFRNTPARWAGLALSLLGWAAVAALAVKSRQFRVLARTPGSSFAESAPAVSRE